MLETSVDLWYVSISVGVLVLVGFISYVLLRVGNLVTDFSLTVKEVTHKLELMDETVNLANDSMRMVNETIRGVLEVVDSIKGAVGDLIVELQKISGLVSGLTGMIGGLSSSLNLLKKKGKK